MSGQHGYAGGHVEKRKTKSSIQRNLVFNLIHTHARTGTGETAHAFCGYMGRLVIFIDVLYRCVPSWGVKGPDRSPLTVAYRKWL